MSLNFSRVDYFRLLIKNDQTESRAVQMLVDDLHGDRQNTVNAFLSHCGSEDFLWALVSFLSSGSARVAGNAAYILGTVAEEAAGQSRILELINGHHPHKILLDLTDLLSCRDSETVMNAAGTIGTLADTPEGREWILEDSSCDKMIRKISNLLGSDDQWTSSNAALVLARISISEEGCQRILAHSDSKKILTQLIASLGLDEAGRGMNAAFALGRLCDTNEGRERLLRHESLGSLIQRLCDMLTGTDPGGSKNSCYALSCLVGTQAGHQCLLEHKSWDMMIHLLSTHLASKEREVGWFAAMTLRMLASRQEGVRRLRDHPDVMPQLKYVQAMEDILEDTRKEVNLTYELLRPLDQPGPPTLEVTGANSIQVTWQGITLPTGQVVTYHLFCDGGLIYEGTDVSHSASGLRANGQHSFQLQVSTESGSSPLSRVALAKTEITVPNAPESLRLLNASPSQLRVVWTAPSLSTGPIKGYMVHLGEGLMDTTTELNSIVSGLAPGTDYTIHVCAYNHKGRGAEATITASTVELGKHSPGRLSLALQGRSAIQATWGPPDSPLGRLHRYELNMNGTVVYSGRDLTCTVRRLSPMTEYTFTVTAVTSDGKCESDPARKRTPKKEYKGQSTAQRFFSHPPKITGQTTGDAKITDTKTPRKSVTAKRKPRSAKSTSPIEHVIPHRSARSGEDSCKGNAHFDTVVGHLSNGDKIADELKMLGIEVSGDETSGDCESIPQPRCGPERGIRHENGTNVDNRLFQERKNVGPYSQHHLNIGIPHRERVHRKAFPRRPNPKLASELKGQLSGPPTLDRPLKGKSAESKDSPKKGTGTGNYSREEGGPLSLPLSNGEVPGLGHSKACCCGPGSSDDFKISSNGVVLYAERTGTRERGGRRDEEAVAVASDHQMTGHSKLSPSSPEGNELLTNEVSDIRRSTTSKETHSRSPAGCYILDLPVQPSAGVNRYRFIPTHLRTQPVSKPGPFPQRRPYGIYDKSSSKEPILDTPTQKMAMSPQIVCAQCRGVRSSMGEPVHKLPVR